MKRFQFILFLLMLLLILLPATGLGLYGQTTKELIRQGNKLYKAQKYSDAEIKYMKSLEKADNVTKGTFNLGDALYKQKNYEDAVKQFDELRNQKLDKETLAKVYHNLGNSYLKANKLKESIEAYKDALRNNPKDMDTKYNLEYARRKLIQQQQKQNKDKKDKDKDKKNKDKKNQKKDKDKKDKNKKDQKKNEKNKDKKDKNKDQQQNQDQKQDEKKQQKDQQQKESDKKMSPKDANRILQALKKEEKKLLKKLRKQKAKRVHIEKNW